MYQTGAINILTWFPFGFCVDFCGPNNLSHNALQMVFIGFYFNYFIIFIYGFVFRFPFNVNVHLHTHTSYKWCRQFTPYHHTHTHTLVHFFGFKTKREHTAHNTISYLQWWTWLFFLLFWKWRPFWHFWIWFNSIGSFPSVF